MGRVFFGGGKVDMKAPIALPSGYTKLAYIQSSRTQYIDTGFKPQNNTRVICDFQITSISAWQGVFAARDANYSNAFCLYINASGVFRSDYGTANVMFDTSVSSTGRHTADKNGTICSIDTTQVTNTSATFTTSSSMFLFASNDNGTIGEYANMKLYSCKIYDNSTLVRDFIPCINASGEIGLYDLVGKQFYGNAGTGTFIGSEVE